MIQKIYDILEGSIALVALIAVVGISTFSIVALNPQISTEAQPQQNVAGIVTNKNQEPVFINNLENNSADYQNNLVSMEDSSYLYSSHIIGGNGASVFKFVEIYNPNSQPKTVIFNTELIGSVQNDLKIKVYDDIDTLVLYSPETGVNEVKLTIPANSKRTLNIAYEFLQKINFGFDVKINLR